MKNLATASLILLSAAIGALAQNGPNAYDNNFDAARRVQVKEASPNATSQGEVRRTVSLRPKHYLPSPLVGEDYRREVASRPVVVNDSPVAYRPDMAGPALVTNTAMVRPRYTNGYTQSGSTPSGNSLSSEEQRLMMATGNNLRGYSTGDDLIDAYIVDSSRRYAIDPLLIYAQMNQESSFKKRALSHKGASGLMQLMPATARRMGVSSIYDPRQNIEGGVKYMRLLLDLFGQDVNLALAGYNAGEGAVMKYGYRIPPYNETQDYVRRISARYRTIAQPVMATRLQNASYK